MIRKQTDLEHKYLVQGAQNSVMLHMCQENILFTTLLNMIVFMKPKMVTNVIHMIEMINTNNLILFFVEPYSLRI